jgi:hypothetical protein
MIKKSLNYHLESNDNNRSESNERNNTADNGIKAKSAPTSQGKVKSKNEIIIGNKCRYWAAYLLKQYDLSVPGWLRTSFKINQRRRKLLNYWLWEANVGKGYCAQCRQSDDWDYWLHRLYHIVNGSTPCK